MKSLCLAAAALLIAGAAAAQTMTDVPAMKCEPKPELPGERMMEEPTVRRRFERDMKAYGDCVKAYVAERQAAAKSYQEAAKAQIDAANSAIVEYNAFAKQTNGTAGVQ